MTSSAQPTVAILGAGSTGCYLAAELLLAKLDVTIICREHIKSSIIANKGIHISDYLGQQQTIMPTNILTEVNSIDDISTQYDVIFVTLKSHQIGSTYSELLAISHSNSDIVFMQNGIGSFDDVKNKLPQRNVYQGITPFNVLKKENAWFHKGTEGHFIWPKTQYTQVIAKAMAQHQLKCDLTNDMQAVICGKLLLNLNNALNAISDLPIKNQLQQRPLRKLLAQAMQEWLNVCQQAQFPVKQFTKLAPKWLPMILRLPNGLFNIIAKPMIAIDPQARSSMWEDIQAQRLTEIDYLNGAVVKLGQQYHVATPINQRICAAIKLLEQGKAVDIHQLTSEHLTSVNKPTS